MTARAELVDLVWNVQTQDPDALTPRDAEEVADAILAAGYRKRRVVTTATELEAVPRGVVLRSKAGSIVARFDAVRGVVFGEGRPFPWGIVDLPAVVLYDPTEA
ncbi:hypothetical protein BO226_11330 [Rhodococcus sp. 2G]|uniref:hypothetical protein n=1 Tax=Rhodococcus sp. 2G TaxID=1570939 RepID=UPI000903AF8F|nr:hypothetical protein [Rhodococcus sp. 2G]APE09725.1 hypothetical protein BO226_11330 [Rhodococcus sp. 2G]